MLHGGELLVDGVNIKEVTQVELRRKIGFVPQKGMLLSGTIESNIKYGNEQMKDEQMIKAAQIAQATEFIDTKENKYNSEIAQGRRKCFWWSKTAFIYSKSNCNRSRNNSF